MRKHVSKIVFLVFVSLWYCSPSAQASPGDFLFKWGTSGSGDGEFLWPYALATDVTGNIYVADTLNNRIQAFDHSGGHLYTIGGSTPGSGDGEFTSPYGITVDNAGNIFVADTWNYRIQVFDHTGSFLRKFSWWDNPFGIALDSSGNIFVSGYYMIQAFSSSGQYLNSTAWSHSGTGLAIDQNNTIYATAPNEEQIKVYDWSGNLLRAWACHPYGVAIDDAGRVYVPDYLNDKIQIFDQMGVLLKEFGGTGTADGQFDHPYGISVNRQGTLIYVADTYNNRIQVFDGFHYIFSGFVAPVSGASARSGNAVPVKFQLVDKQGKIVSIAKATLGLRYDTGSGWSDPPIPATSTGGSNVGNTFRYDKTQKQYIFNLDAKSLASIALGNWQLELNLDNGSTYVTTITLVK